MTKLFNKFAGNSRARVGGTFPSLALASFPKGGNGEANTLDTAGERAQAAGLTADGGVCAKAGAEGLLAVRSAPVAGGAVRGAATLNGIAQAVKAERLARDIEALAVKAVAGQAHNPEGHNQWTVGEPDCLGSAYGQKDFAIRVNDKHGNWAGHVDYSEYQGKPAIKWIEVDPKHRRKGIGTLLVKKLQEQYPRKKIAWGMTTEDGTSLKEHLNASGIETEDMVKAAEGAFAAGHKFWGNQWIAHAQDAQNDPQGEPSGKIRHAVLVIAGKRYKGPSHFQAYMGFQKSEPESAAKYASESKANFALEGFETESGHFMTRRQGSQYVGLHPRYAMAAQDLNLSAVDGSLYTRDAVQAAHPAFTNTEKRGCLMLMIYGTLENDLLEWGKANIPDSALDPTEGREIEPHATIFWGFNQDFDPTRLTAMLRNTGPVDIELGTVSRFECPDYDVLKVEVDSPKLENLNKRIGKVFENDVTPSEHPYHPHITIAYLKKGACRELDGGKVFEGQAFATDELLYSLPERKGRQTVSTDYVDAADGVTLDTVQAAAFHGNQYVRVEDYGMRKLGGALGRMGYHASTDPSVVLSAQIDPKAVFVTRLDAVEKGKGAGSAAIKRIKDFAAASGRRVELTAGADTPELQSRLNNFYERHGFRKTDDAEHPSYVWRPENVQAGQSIEDVEFFGVHASEPHDVSGEARDEAGKWKTVGAGYIPSKHGLSRPIKGPTGATIIGYEWRSHIDDVWSEAKQETVERRVSDWGNSDVSTGTKRNIVHVFHVLHPDGIVRPEGIRSAQNVLGIAETRLQTIAKHERAAQQYREQQEQAESELMDKIAKATPAEAAQSYRSSNYSPMRTFEQNNEVFNQSVLFQKGDKYIRRNSKATDFLLRHGWVIRENDPAKLVHAEDEENKDSVRASDPISKRESTLAHHASIRNEAAHEYQKTVNKVVAVLEAGAIQQAQRDDGAKRAKRREEELDAIALLLFLAAVRIYRSTSQKLAVVLATGLAQGQSSQNFGPTAVPQPKTSPYGQPGGFTPPSGTPGAPAYPPEHGTMGGSAWPATAEEANTFASSRAPLLVNFPREAAERLDKELEEGRRIGEDAHALAQRLAKKAQEIEDGQGRVVAETEGQAAYGQGQLSLLQRAGFATVMWDQLDRPTKRDSHAENMAIGEVPIGHWFPSGQQFPGDGRAGAGECVNCACSLVGVKRKAGTGHIQASEPVRAAEHDVSGEARDASGKWTAEGVSVFMHPNTSVNDKFMARAVAEYFKSLEKHGVSVSLKPSDENLGEINAGGQKFNKAGEYDAITKTIRAHVEPGILAHEMGHAEIDFALERRKRALQDLSMRVRSEKSDIFAVTGNVLRADERIRDPQSADQEVHNAVMDFEYQLHDDKSHPTDYSKAWNKEYIYDGPVAVEHPVGYEEGKPYGGRESILLTCAIKRGVNEAYAEFNRGYVLTDLQKRGILDTIPDGYKFSKMGTKESRDAFLTLRKAIHKCAKET